MSEVITDRVERIFAFLQECENELWDLNNDDISHVLSLDFDYVRKANTIAETFDSVDELKCVACNKIFEEDDGMYNYPDGVRCSKCGDNYTGWKKKLKKHYQDKPQDIKKEFDENMTLGASTIGSYIIPNKLLIPYAEKVNYLRRAIMISIGRDDPLIIQKALTQREKLHREIFSHIGLPYHTDLEASKDSMEFNNLLDEWISAFPITSLQDCEQ